MTTFTIRISSMMTMIMTMIIKIFIVILIILLINITLAFSKFYISKINNNSKESNNITNNN